MGEKISTSEGAEFPEEGWAELGLTNCFLKRAELFFLN